MTESYAAATSFRTSASSGSLRWLAPEHFDSRHEIEKDRKTDSYAFAMTLWEVQDFIALMTLRYQIFLSSRLSLVKCHSKRSDFQIATASSRGERPPRKLSIADEIWNHHDSWLVNESTRASPDVRVRGFSACIRHLS